MHQKVSAPFSFSTLRYFKISSSEITEDSHSVRINSYQMRILAKQIQSIIKLDLILDCKMIHICILIFSTTQDDLTNYISFYFFSISGNFH